MTNDAGALIPCEMFRMHYGDMAKWHYGHLLLSAENRKQKVESRKAKNKMWGWRGGEFMASVFLPFQTICCGIFFLDQIIFLQKGGHPKSAIAES